MGEKKLNVEMIWYFHGDIFDNGNKIRTKKLMIKIYYLVNVEIAIGKCGCGCRCLLTRDCSTISKVNFIFHMSTKCH